MEAVTSTQGNLTHEECNGRGNCNTKTGQCSCDCGFGPRQDKEGQFRPCAWLGESTKPACCPREATSREDCTIDKYCSDNEETCFGHGKCDSIESTCQCHQGWQGIDCSESKWQTPTPITDYLKSWLSEQRFNSSQRNVQEMLAGIWFKVENLVPYHPFAQHAATREYVIPILGNANASLHFLETHARKVCNLYLKLNSLLE